MTSMHRRVSVGITIVGVALLLAAAPVTAHHAFSAEFDGDKPVTLTGTVTKIEWLNPHVWIHVEVKGQDGQLVSWEIEAGAPNALMRRGWRKDSLPPGVTISVFGYRAKNGSNKANGRDLTLPDGRVLFAGSSGTGAPYDEPKR
jgi:hypothetical protein